MAFYKILKKRNKKSFVCVEIRFSGSKNAKIIGSGWNLFH
jgi:hypothetical protein